MTVGFIEDYLLVANRSNDFFEQCKFRGQIRAPGSYLLEIYILHKQILYWHICYNEITTHLVHWLFVILHNCEGMSFTSIFKGGSQMMELNGKKCR